MSQSVPMEPYEQEGAAIADYRRQSREFLTKGRGYLGAGDWHQAAEKGWGAAAWMTKAVAEAQGWQCKRRDEFFTVVYQAQDSAGDARLRGLGNAHRKHASRVLLHAQAVPAPGNRRRES